MGETRKWSNLPLEILLQIFQRLVFPDTRRFASVCSSWYSIFISEAPKTPISFDRSAPWLMIPDLVVGPGSSENARWIGRPVRRFFNPSENRYYDIEAPDFAGAVCHAAVRDWLLLSVCRLGERWGHGYRFWGFFFFNPFTRTRFDLPDVDVLLFDLAVCSVPPTCSDCSVLLIKKGYDEFVTTVLKEKEGKKKEKVVAFKTNEDASSNSSDDQAMVSRKYHNFRKKKNKVLEHKNPTQLASYTHKNLANIQILDAVYCGGQFYLYGLSGRGHVLSFNPNDGSLQHVLELDPLGRPSMGIYLVESLGHILAITRGAPFHFNGEGWERSGNGSCELRLLDFANQRLTEVSEEIDGQMLFIGVGMSMSIKAPSSAEVGTIYFSKAGYFEGGMCKFVLGDGHRPTLLPNGGIYELPRKQVEPWPMSFTGDAFCDMGLLNCYIRMPRLGVYRNSSGEWYASGGNEEIWIETPPF